MKSNSIQEINITFDHVEKRSTISGQAYVIYLNVKNLRSERSKLFVSPLYTTQKGEEIDIDLWDAGFGNGKEGFTINSETFKKIGCFYWYSKLPQITHGDKLILEAWIENGSTIHEFIFECIDATKNKFKLLSTLLNPVSVGHLSTNGVPKEITHLVERLELIEEKFNISIEGIYATCCFYDLKSFTISSYEVELKFDVIGNGIALDRNFSIRANVYNTQSQLLGTQTTFIRKDQFVGFATQKINISVNQFPMKLRLFPEAGY